MSEAQLRIEDMMSLPNPKQIRKAIGGYCIHDIFADWCAMCKHENLPDIKQAVLEDNIDFVERIHKWPPRSTWR